MQRLTLNSFVMAKQSGIHQLRGKVGEMSYYRQTGINPGLARRINQAMSERVKTSAEYTNTRLLNAEFGQAGRIAGVVAQTVKPKYRPMMLPFSQSKLVKGIYDAITAQTGVWGRRGLNDPNGVITAPLLSALAKNDPSLTGFYWSNDPEDILFFGFDGQLLREWLDSIGADKIRVNAIRARCWQGVWQSTTGKYPDALVTMSQRQGQWDIEGAISNNFDPDFVTPIEPSPAASYSEIPFFVFVIMPLRTVGTTSYVLQEHCTFVALSRSDIAWGPVDDDKEVVLIS